ncbi:MAG TPA: hypothetical protein VMT74_06590 [Gaiellaceae bacterium]|nr:hypothetical protein [Gaiellaceae bacterium]
MDARTFQAGVLGGHESVKGFRVVATDGHAGRVSWASYAPGESYLVVTTGFLRRRHRVLPAGAVGSVAAGEVRVSLSRSQVAALPLLTHPQAPVADETVEQMLNAFERAASTPQSGGF